MAEIGEAVAMLPNGPHVIDGELASLVDGVSDFTLLQARARKRKPYPGGTVVTYGAFDLPVVDGNVHYGKPLVERKARLQRC